MRNSSLLATAVSAVRNARDDITALLGSVRADITEVRADLQRHTAAVNKLTSEIWALADATRAVLTRRDSPAPPPPVPEAPEPKPPAKGGKA